LFDRETSSIPCNLCQSTDVDVIARKDREGKPLQTVMCRHCGLIWTDPRPAPKEIVHFYSKSYRREYKNIVRPKKKHVYRDGLETIKRHRFFQTVAREGDTLMDIGAGNGVFVYCMRQLGFDAKGVEPDEDFARYAREALGIPVITGFASDIKKTEHYDLVTLHHVLEHMTDSLAELRHLWRLLKQNGHLIIEVPNAEDILQAPGNRYHKAHIYTFNPETLSALLTRAGFSVVTMRVAPYNGNISAIFQKKDEVWDNNTLNQNGNYAKMVRFFKRHTPIRHYTSPIPYTKLFRNLSAALREWIAIREFHEDKAMLNAVVSKYLDTRAR